MSILNTLLAIASFIVWTVVLAPYISRSQILWAKVSERTIAIAFCVECLLLGGGMHFYNAMSPGSDLGVMADMVLKLPVAFLLFKHFRITK